MNLGYVVIDQSVCTCSNCGQTWQGIHMCDPKREIERLTRDRNEARQLLGVYREQRDAAEGECDRLRAELKTEHEALMIQTRNMSARECEVDCLAKERDKAQSILKAREDTLELRWQDVERLEKDVERLTRVEADFDELQKDARELATENERLREIPCIVESPDGNPGWSTVGDAVKLLGAAYEKVERLTSENKLQWENIQKLLAENERLEEALRGGE